jgi:hypothetical protein
MEANRGVFLPLELRQDQSINKIKASCFIVRLRLQILPFERKIITTHRFSFYRRAFSSPDHSYRSGFFGVTNGFRIRQILSHLQA